MPAIPEHQNRSDQKLAVGVVLLTGFLSFILTMRPGDDDHVYLLSSEVRLPGACISRIWLNTDCPGCGLTRSIVCLSHGEWGRGVRMNPAGPLIYLSGLLLLAYTVLHRWVPADHPFNRRRYWTILIWLIVLALIGQWLGRLIFSLA